MNGFLMVMAIAKKEKKFMNNYCALSNGPGTIAFLNGNLYPTNTNSPSSSLKQGPP